MDQLDLVRVGLVERGIVHDQYPASPLHLRFDLVPQRGGVRFETMQQAGEGVVCRGIGPTRLHAGRLGCAHRPRRGERNWM